MSRRSAIPSHLSFARGVLGFAFTREREERKWNGHGRSQRFLSIYTGQSPLTLDWGLGVGQNMDFADLQSAKTTRLCCQVPSPSRTDIITTFQHNFCTYDLLIFHT